MYNPDVFDLAKKIADKHDDVTPLQALNATVAALNKPESWTLARQEVLDAVINELGDQVWEFIPEEEVAICSLRS